MLFKFLRPIGALSLLTMSLAVSAGGSDDQMQKIYLDMENYSSGAKFDTQMRTGFVGGRYTYKTKISSINLVAMDLPSAKGGCNGIDIMGGSLSFVSEDQIIAFLKTIASNAKGYAFNLALENMCPSCVNWMNELQNKVQALNESLTNSCQMAKGFVDGGIEAIQEKDVTKITDRLVKSGFASDAVKVVKGLDPSNQEGPWAWWGKTEPSKVEAARGSVLMKSMSSGNYNSWFTGSDQQFMEEMLSYIGSYSMGELVDGTEAGVKGKLPKTMILPPLPMSKSFSLKKLLEGSNGEQITIYDCSKSKTTPAACDIGNGDTHDVVLKGLAPRITEVLMGSQSLISKINSQDYSSALDSKFKNLAASLPNSFGTMYANTAAISPDAAALFVESTINAVTLQFAYDFMKDAISVARTTVLEYQESDTSEQLKMLNDANQRLENEYAQLLSVYGPSSTVIERYSEILKILPAKTYITPDATSTAKKN
ncbi:MAG: hypothetical protein EOO52_13530 [Gammaproteobacteria bacterium]|nr:MAG: hypothetical protein EOO52_13530 [Gammaproteobacteria bacterium]